MDARLGGQVQSDVFYVEGTGARELDTGGQGAGTDDYQGRNICSISEFQQAFEVFLLNFSENGENVYKEQIRRLDFHQFRAGGSEDLRNYGAGIEIPSLRVDLEHLNMPHWLMLDQALPQGGDDVGSIASALGGSQSAFGGDAETASQISGGIGQGWTRGKRYWAEMLSAAFYEQPLKFAAAAEEVVRAVFAKLQPEKSNGITAASGDRTDFDGTSEMIAASQAQGGSPLLLQLELLSHRSPLSLRNLGANIMEQLVVLEGIVVQARRPEHKAVRVRLQCRKCEHQLVLSVALWRQGIEIPRFCRGGGNASASMEMKCPPDSYTTLSDESTFCDVQSLRLQELPEHVPTGDMPRHISLSCANALCGRVLPGDRVRIVGVYSTHVAGKRGDSSKEVAYARQPYVHVLGIEKGVAAASSDFSIRTGCGFDKHEAFRAIARDPNVFEQVCNSVAPALFGLRDIKESIACLLFGGSRKVLPDGSKLRGDINILLLGDPSTAKSQFLKFVERAAPIAIYTSGKGSSAAGLTAAVVRDAQGNFALEGGAMVLADGGIVCIDEFDKMRSDDRVAIHEAMEQQTISIAKAGINTVLFTRCAVLAAANPAFGSYDESNDTSDQHDFETTILSRFDLIWLLRDEKCVERDRIIARHVFDLHSGASSQEEPAGSIPIDLLSEYIKFCRENCNPGLSSEAAKKLENFYVEVREAVRKDGRRTRDRIPVTVRQLESLVRLAEALAKIELSSRVTETHVERAIRLFNLSTVEAAKSALVRQNLSAAELKRVQQAEDCVLQQLAMGQRASKAHILHDMRTRGFEAPIALRALRALVHKGVLQERGDASLRRTAPA